MKVKSVIVMNNSVIVGERYTKDNGETTITILGADYVKGTITFKQDGVTLIHEWNDFIERYRLANAIQLELF